MEDSTLQPLNIESVSCMVSKSVAWLEIANPQPACILSYFIVIKKGIMLPKICKMT
jgi:hypothetical protein